ncbi:MAG: DoxX family protein [Planctomycetes bacterium]|nr:DoxX family protein [Planctomycetota bacterium]
MNLTDPRVRADLGLLLARAFVGLVFAFHGSQKLFGWFGGYGLEATGQWMESIGIPFGTVSALLAGAAELGGGLLLIAGLLQPLVAVPLVVTMLVAALTAHQGFAAQAGGMEYPLTLAFVTAGLGLTGAGRFALGARAAESPVASGAPAAGARA